MKTLEVVTEKEKRLMGCDDVKRVAYFYLDGQLGTDRGTAFSSHLEECKDCEDRITIHRRLRGFFKKRLSPQFAPQTLHQRLQTSFASMRMQPGTL